MSINEELFLLALTRRFGTPHERLIVLTMAACSEVYGRDALVRTSTTNAAFTTELSLSSAREALARLTERGIFLLEEAGHSKRLSVYRISRDAILALPELVECFYCARGQSEIFEREHQHPRSRGGRGGENIVWSCGPCNRRKAAMTVEEFRKRFFPPGHVFPGERHKGVKS